MSPTYGLIMVSQSLQAGKITIAEIGCGAGNSVFPLMNANQNPELTMLAFDYASHAVKLVQVRVSVALPKPI